MSRSRRTSCSRWAGSRRSCSSAAKRQSALAKARSVCPHATAIDARWVHVVACTRELTGPELAQLGAMLSYGPSAVITTIPDGSLFKAETIETDSFFITPRVGTTSPWSSKATDIARVCGLSAITRIARATEWTVTGQGIDGAVIGAALSDRMTESVILREADLDLMLGHSTAARGLATLHANAETLRIASRELGLALAADELV